MSADKTPILDQNISELDPEIAAVLDGELARQQGTLEMIASENFVPRAVLQAQGSVLTNKYAEGYPGRRYYGGCEFVDVVERLAIERAQRLFGAEHVNVQPHSGTSANMAVYFAVLKPGATLGGDFDLLIESDLAGLSPGAGSTDSRRFGHYVVYGRDAAGDHLARLGGHQ